jgi:hypothetical protein
VVAAYESGLVVPARERYGEHQPSGWQWSPPADADGARSIAGFRSKKPNGLSVNPVYSTGMTGKSSGRQKWVTPTVCQTTMSVSTTERSAAVHRGSPSPPGCWFGKSPAARRPPPAARRPPLVGRVRQ